MHSGISGGSGLCTASFSDPPGMGDARWTQVHEGVIFNGALRQRPSTFHAREDSMAEKNKKKTYLILIAVLLVVLLITFL